LRGRLPASTPKDVFKEAVRQFNICNACRYCEGYCDVWPAMELKTSFEKNDVMYLANLCHDCRECFYACPYTPPHEFNVNIPQVLSEVRLKSYEEFTRPKFLSKAFEKQYKSQGAVILASVVSAFLAAILMGDPARLFVPQLGLGSFYVIFPYLAIILAGFLVGLFVLFSFARGISEFWRAIGGSFGKFFLAKAVAGAVSDALGHKWFGGGGAGCNHPKNKPSYSFLTLHALVIYGFILDICSTLSAAVYQDVLRILPPYPILSFPVLLGIVGGLEIIGGTSVLTYYKVIGDSVPAYKGMLTLDFSFLLTLDAVAVTGLLTLILRSSTALGFILAIHLGLVLALFITAPYGKFVHFVYRFGALVNSRLAELVANSS
jgi:citrate/tricarballylate utilization protein